MGVALEVWRQRIGRFKVPGSKVSRCSYRSEVVFAAKSWGCGLGGSTYIGILLCVAAGLIMLSLRFDNLPVCGDVELNPGPVSLLSDDVLHNLTSMNLDQIKPIDSGIRNKHIWQLHKLRENSKATWENAVMWLKTLNADFPVEDANWPRNISSSWRSLMDKRRKLQSSKFKGERQKQDFLNWEDQLYKLPEVHGPRLPPKPSFAEVSAENEKLLNANDKLTHEIASVSTRQPPHKQELQDRREQRKSVNVKKHLKTIRKQNQKIDKMDSRLTEKQKEKRKMAEDLTKSEAKHAKLEDKQRIEKDSYMFSLEDDAVKAEERVKELEEELKQCKEVNAILIDACLNWRKKLAHVRGETLEFLQKGAFSADMRKCVWELLGLHVAQEKVPKVIEAVMNLAQKNFDKVPSNSTIRIMADEMQTVATVQLQSLAEAGNLNLQTDETPKFGQCYEAFVVNTDNQDSYLLGMRHMANKSAQTTLDTFKEILHDINTTCTNITNTDNIGYKILTKVHSTMTDRAKTETKFHNILQTFRAECLPLYKEHWDTLTEDVQGKLSTLYKFFCGLHLMVGMADTVNATLKSIEGLSQSEVETEEEEEAAAHKVDGESVIVRCVRTICKALARGADEKSGRHKDWKTYCTKIGHPEYVSMLETFKGNRFNIIFLLGGNVFFLREHIMQCLQEIPEPKNKLIRVATALMNSHFNIAGCKALGIMRKFLMMPLWRITEEKGHILEMNDCYDKMENFLLSCNDVKNVADFMSGINMPFSGDFRDELSIILTTNDEHTNLVCSMLQSCLKSLHLYVKRTVCEHLPGGTYWEAHDDVRQNTTSAPRHNKNPERVFGMLDFLCHHRPNASALSNEAILMFVYNKTNDWIKKKSKTELENLCKDVKQQSRNMRILYRKREEEIINMHIKKQQDEAVKYTEKKERKFKKRTELTTSIIDSGLWQSEGKVDEMMEACDSDAERKRALLKQITFRNDVLQQHYTGPIPKIFNATFTHNKVKHIRTWIEIKNCLIELINAAMQIDTSRTVSKDTREREKLPMLVGKTINHTFDDGVVYRGTVISQVPGFCAWFNLKYENDETIYTFRLVDDYKKGDVEIIPETLHGSDK